MRAAVRHLAVVGVATVATVGSLWFQYGLGLYPCTLCWYQRVLMYPIVAIGIVAMVTGQPLLRTAIGPLALGGFAIAGYHSWLQVQSGAVGCTVGACASIQWQLWGVLSIPTLAAIAFGAIGITVLSAVVDTRW
jgi:disulfide bond formation protein DsbB